MIIALQMLILFRESVLAVLNGWLPPFFRQLVRKLSDNGLVPAEDEIEDQVYADYDEECGVVFFPPVHAQRYAAVCDCLMDERWFGKLEKILNIGKHYDVNFMKYLTEVSGIAQILGLDITSSLNCTCDMLDISFADCKGFDKPLQITLLQGNAADPDYRLIGCDAVIGIELIQKLLPHDLDRIVHNVFGFIKPRVALFTTPNADFNILMKDLDNNGLRQSDHYFEWTREQLHDWCSNIVGRYPDYTVVSRGVCPGPPGTSHYGCFCQLVLFISKHYTKEMELNVDSLVAVSNPPEPEQDNEIGWITPTSVPSSHSMLHRLLEDDLSDFHWTSPESSSEGTLASILEQSLKSITNIDKNIQCNVEAEFGKSFVMFNEDEMYEVRIPRKVADRSVYEIGDVANRLNNTMHEVKYFSKTTQYLMEKNELNSEDLMDEVLQLTEKLTSKMNSCTRKESNLWNNINWGENVPYWNQYYKVVGVYTYPYEGKSEDDTLLNLLSDEINKAFDAQAPGSQLGIPLDTLMNAVKHITDDVERVITLMEDSGYELEGDSVVYTGVDVSDASHEDKFDCKSEFDSISNETACGQDVNGRLLNRKLGRKVRMLRLMLQHDDEVKQALGQVVCRLKKIAMSSGRDKRGEARTKWLQSKLLDILTLTEKSILRRKLKTIENEPLKGLAYDEKDDTACLLTKIKAEDDTAQKIVEKYEKIFQMSADNSDNNSENDSENSHTSKFANSSRNTSRVDLTKSNMEKEFFEVPAPETDNLSYSPHEELTRYILDASHIDSDVQYWEEKDMSLYQEETIEPKDIKHDDKLQPKQMKSRKESKIITSTSISPNDELTRYTLDASHIDNEVQYWEGKVTKLYQDETVEPRDIKYDVKSQSKQPKQMKSRKESKIRTSSRSAKRKKSNSSNSSISSIHKNKAKNTVNLITVKRSLKYSASYKLLDRKIENTPKHEKPLKKVTYNNTLNCIETIRKKMGPTLVLSVPAKPIPESLFQLCHPELHQKTVNTVQKSSEEWDEGMDTPVAASEHSHKIEILSHNETLTIALQRMIGTDPDVDTEILEHELELSDRTSLLTETSSCLIPRTGPGSPDEGEPTIAPAQELNDLRSIGKRSVPSIAVTVKTPVVEILTQDGCELIALQRTIGTDPVYFEVYERELFNSKLTNPVKYTETLDKVEPVDGDVSSQEFFLYDINEPTTSKGLRHMGMDVQCGTDGLVSATTSASFPLRKYVPGIKLENSFTDIRADLKTDCVTSTNDILKPCGKRSPPWMKSVGIKIKDSLHEIGTPAGKDTKAAEMTVVNDQLLPSDSMILETLHPNQQHSINNNVDKHTKKIVSNIQPDANNTKCSVEFRLPKSGGDLKTKDTNLRKPESTGVVTRFLHVPKGVRSKLSCGGVHVHSYKDVQVSEDVMYQGEWQRYRQKPLRKNPIYGNIKKLNRPSVDKLKYNRKINLSNKSQKTTPEPPKAVITTPLIIRNTKASKMKEDVTKINLQKKLAATKPQVIRNRSATLPKVASKHNLSISKSVKEKSNKLIQPRRQTRFAQQSTVVNENKILNAQNRNVYIPSYMHHMLKKQLNQKIPSKLGVKTGSLSNLLNVSNEQITSKISQSQVEELVSALLKVSIEPAVKYIVYRNKKVNLQSDIDRIPVSIKESLLKHQPSNRSQHGSAYMTTDSATIIINPVVTITKSFQPKRQSIPTKSRVTGKVSESKMLSRIKKIARLFSKKSPTNVSEDDRFPGTSVSPKSSPILGSFTDLASDENDCLRACEASHNSSFVQSFANSSNSELESISHIEGKECDFAQDYETVLVTDADETDSISRESVAILSDHTEILSRESGLIEPDESILDTNNTINAMRQMVEECICCIDPPSLIVNTVSETTDVKRPDPGTETGTGTGTGTGTETFETGSSFRRTNDDPSLASIARSFSDFSCRLQPSTSKLSGCIADHESWSNVEPSRDNSNILPRGSKETVNLTQRPVTSQAFSSFSVNAEPSPMMARQVPDHVNLVDSETGSCANASRRATSEEVLLSGRSSASYVSCALDEDAAIPSWLYNISQHASGSFASVQQPIPEEVPELEYDVNGNELTVHGAGAGDGYGIHSDQSQDSSGQGTSFSSSPNSSGLPSETIVVDPATFMADYEPGERPNSSNAQRIREESSDSPVNTGENSNPSRPLNRNRIPRTPHRVSMSASDADISSIGTDVASDN